MGGAIEEGEKHTLIFIYGTLKKGFANHGLLEDKIATGDVSYIGPYKTTEEFPLLCGPFRVPFLLNLPGSGHRVSGELYTVSPATLALMDEFEGISKGHYERLPVKVVPAVVVGEEVQVMTCAEAYYAHRCYAEEMLKRNGGEGEGTEGSLFFGNYSKKEAEGYVKQKDRPRDVSFLNHIRLFVSSSSSSSNTTSDSNNND